MYRDYEEYMKTVLGYKPVQEGINRGTYINPYNDFQFNNINPIFPKTTVPINNKETRFQPAVPLNITSARQQISNVQNTTSVKQQSDIIQNNTLSRQQVNTTKNAASVKQQDNMTQNTTNTKTQDITQNRNTSGATRMQAINNNNNKIPRQGNPIKSIEKNTPATSYKNFLKF